ncbi:MAG: hypothetical protein JWQ73_136 [Variovorax sp.]|jgi:hypothetical protein|nr:hypothetical protein [Variovorax sp.]
MKFPSPTLPLLAALLCVCVPAMAAQDGLVAVSQQQHSSDLRDAVEAHRASQREEVRREEAAAGRRLTAAELAELREQVRQQWAVRTEVVRSAESQPVEGMVASPESRAVQVPAPRLQRP